MKDFTQAEKLLFRRIFEEILDREIPALLFDIWTSETIKVHPLPDLKVERTIKLFQYGASPTFLTVEEFADYRRLPSDDLGEVLRVVDDLAKEAAKSYAWNVRNAYTKDGRLRVDLTLHVTDWVKEFHVNVVKSSWEIDPVPSKGWVSYRYRFAAGKI